MLQEETGDGPLAHFGCLWVVVLTAFPRCQRPVGPRVVLQKWDAVGVRNGVAGEAGVTGYPAEFWRGCTQSEHGRAVVSVTVVQLMIETAPNIVVRHCGDIGVEVGGGSVEPMEAEWTAAPLSIHASAS